LLDEKQRADVDRCALDRLLDGDVEPLVLERNGPQEAAAQTVAVVPADVRPFARVGERGA
jgi:hypothetical protein